MDLLYFIKALYKRKWIILLCVMVAVAAAVYFTHDEKKTYKSTAQLATGFTISDAVDLTGVPSDIYSSDLKFNNIIETITSPQVVNLLSCRLIIHDIDNPKAAFRSKPIRNSSDYAKIDLRKARQVFEGKLRDMKMLSSYRPEERELLNLLIAYGYDQKSLDEMINVSRLNRTDYINIECHSDNPLMSAFIVNALCEEFNRFYDGYLSQRSESNLQFLDTLVEQKQQVLSASQNALKELMEGGNGDISATTAGLIGQYQTRLTSRKSDLTTALLSLKAVEKQIEEYNAAQKASTVISGDIVQITNKINDLTASYVNGGSKDQQLLSQINSLKNDLQDKYASMPEQDAKQPTKSDLVREKDNYEVQAKSAQADIDRLQGSIAALGGDLRTSSGRNIMIQSLQKDIDAAMGSYNDVKSKYDMAKNSVAQRRQFKQILFGQPSLTPERSKRMMVIGLTGAIVLALSVFVIVLIEYFDISIKIPSQFQKQTGLDVINVTNRVDLKKYRVLEIVAKEALKNERRKNTFRELVRKIRQSIGKSDKRVILFTSTEHGQGKTTLMQAIAFSMSMSKKKVLLIDTNFCNNDLTLELNAKPIIEKFSVEGTLDSENLKSIITETNIPGVDVIGCEGGDYSPLEILPQGNLLEHLGELKEQYDYIFIEAAPMNAFTDVRELVDYVDSIVTIFSADSVIRPADYTAIEYLRTLNGKFQGAILNKVDLENLEA